MSKNTNKFSVDLFILFVIVLILVRCPCFLIILNLMPDILYEKFASEWFSYFFSQWTCLFQTGS